MLRPYLIILSMLMASLGYSQTEIRFSASVKPQPVRMFFDTGNPDEIDEHIDFWPVLQAELGLKIGLGKSRWFILPELSYRYTQLGAKLDLRDNNNNLIAEDVYAGDYYNFLGLRLGAGYTHRFSRKLELMLPLGLQAHFPFASGFRVEGYPISNPLYQDENFEKGIFYGAYLRPGLNFRLAPRNPWKLGIFAEADLLFRNQSEMNPILLGGGGVAVSYAL